MSFFAELKRRNVVRVGAAYAVLGWAIAQVAEFAFETFGAPDWTLKALVIVLLLGLPLALFFAWAFELTPDGIKREKDVDREQPGATRGGRNLDRAIIVVLLIALAWFAWDRFMAEPLVGQGQSATADASDASRRAAEVSEAAAKSIAVLPFVAMSSGPDDGYFADGLTEEILNSLAGLPELLVTARTSAFSFKGRDVPVQEIAEVLGVRHILEGSVRRSGERLRVTAQLVRADDGFHLWSNTYDRDAGDSFAIQTDIAEKVAVALDVVLDDDRRAQMARRNVRNPEAFVAFQKGRELHARAHDDLPQLPTLAKANAYLEEAVRLEPDFYTAYMTHTDYFTHTLIDYADQDPDLVGISEEELTAARRGLEADLEAAIRSAPDPARRLDTEYDRALLLGNWRGLASLTDRVLANDDCAIPEWHNLTSIAFGRAREALRDYENLSACDPLLARNVIHRTMGHIWAQQFDEAVAISSAENLEAGGWRFRAHFDALIAAGRLDEAQRLIETHLRDPQRAPIYEARVAAMRGDEARLREIFREAATSAYDARTRLLAFAISGDRDAANAAAASMDGRPLGYIPLLQAVYFCFCGAPFDLEATPVFAAMLETSGLPWPPQKVVNWPLKAW